MTGSEQLRRPPTIEDVARHTGLSRQTISRVINKKGSVRETTRARVLEAIREMGYRPNTLARGLVTSRTEVVGLIVPDITDPFYPEIARWVEEGADEAGYSVFLCHIADSAEREASALERLQGHRVDGVIICNPRQDDQCLRHAINGAFPVVTINRRIPGVWGAVIWPGYRRGSEIATTHLLEAGRRNVRYLGIDPADRIQADKLAGFRRSLAAFGIEYTDSHFVETAESAQGGFEAMARLLDHQYRVDGIVACNDVMAIGAMRCALDRGIRVPEEIAFVGYGGSDVAAMVVPSLSTIEIPLHCIGRAAIRELLALIDGEGEHQRVVQVTPRLVARGTSP